MNSEAQSSSQNPQSRPLLPEDIKDATDTSTSILSALPCSLVSYDDGKPPAGQTVQDGGPLLHRLSSTNSASDSHSQPRPSRSRKRKLNTVNEQESAVHTPWTEFLSPCRPHETVSQRLHDEIIALERYMNTTAEERTARKSLLDEITFLVTTSYDQFLQGAAAVLFGSSAQDLSLLSGDLDIAIKAPAIADGNQQQIQRSLGTLMNRLKTRNFVENISIIRHARIPIVKLVTSPQYGSFHMDIGINNLDGYKAVPVIQSYVQKHRPLRPLLLVLKALLTHKNLNDASKSGLSSYALLCMTISFLQLNPTKISSDDFSDPIGSRVLGKLLMGLLDYYGKDGKFSYGEMYISVTEGKLLPREGKEAFEEKREGRKSVAIQCLMNPDNNVGKSAGRIEAVKEVFRNAYNTLNSYTDIDNCLGSIIRLTDKTVNHRELVRQAVLQGYLHPSSHSADSGTRPQRPTQPNYGHDYKPRDPSGARRGAPFYVPQSAGGSTTKLSLAERLGVQPRPTYHGGYGNHDPAYYDQGQYDQPGGYTQRQSNGNQEHRNKRPRYGGGYNGRQ